MATTGTVQTLNINDLKKYSTEARVNLPLMASKDFVTRMNCYEPGQVTPFHVHPHDDARFRGGVIRLSRVPRDS